MGFIPETLDGVDEDRAVAEGPYDLTITKANPEAVSTAGNDMLEAWVRIEGEEEAPEIGVWIVYPIDGEEKRITKLHLLSLKRFLYTFDVLEDYKAKGLTREILEGATASNVLLKQEPDRNGVIRNVIVYPRLPDGV